MYEEMNDEGLISQVVELEHTVPLFINEKLPPLWENLATTRLRGDGKYLGVSNFTIII